LELIERALSLQSLPDEAQEIILYSWRKGTKKQYKVYLNKWNLYCIARGLDPLLLPTDIVLGFLTSLYKTGVGYSALCTARSALSALASIQGRPGVGDNPLIKRFLKGVFQVRPTCPKYSSTWDVTVVLDYIRVNWTRHDVSLKHLTFKLVMLIALVTGQRGQTIHLLELNTMVVKQDAVEFQVQDKVKTSAPGRQQPIVILPMYKADVNLCVVATLHDYIVRTALLRSEDSCRLFISFAKPYKPVSRDTISRWTLTAMALAGVDTTIFKAHSTRSAATSAASRKNVPIDTILSTAGWQNASTFAKFYKKQIKYSNVFANSVLQGTDSN